MKMIDFIKTNYWLLLILVVGGLLRFYKLDFQSIWVDELHTMIECNPEITYKESYKIAAFREQMPQLYFLLVKVFSTIFGHTPFVTRAFSVLVGTISLYGIYLLGKEIINARLGLIAAALLAVNIFHISYSQEARPYAMLALMTIFSFYRLVIFIKRSSYLNAFYFGLFSALMINTHFFGLFTLIAQALIILFFLFDFKKEERINFLIKSLFAGLTIIVLWLPSILIFLHVMTIKSFWILPPSLDVYTQLFKEFFGNSESVVFMLFILITFYFVKLFDEKRIDKSPYRYNNILMSFVVFTSWIFITLFIPLVRSYLDIPMIISRYFIGVLPAVLLIAAIGLYSIKSNLVRAIIISFIVIASLSDLFVIKDYYNTVNKSQFREITASLTKRNVNGDKVVSSWGWLMSYFLNEEHTRTPLLLSSSKNNVAVESTFENYIALMRNGTIPMDSFWYLDGNSRPYNLSADDEKFLTDNFRQKESITMFDTWTRHYISKTEKVNKKRESEFALRNFTPLLVDAEGNFTMFENSTIKSPDILLEDKFYNLIIEARSTPDIPIKKENAHIIVKLGNQQLASYFLSERKEEIKEVISFKPKQIVRQKISITFDNDLSVDGQDRNVIIYNIKIEEK